MVKTLGFDPSMRRFESYLPSQLLNTEALGSRQVVKTLGFDPSMRRFESYLPSHILSI